MARRIIVSDLHIDTWREDEQYGVGRGRKTKLEHWRDFLRWCADSRIDELIVNGDLIDAPPYEDEPPFARVTAEALIALMEYATTRRVTYIFGNHDIGISGIRCAFSAGLPALKNVSLRYPNHRFLTAAGTVVIEHGHLHDPVLGHYLRHLGKSTYVNSDFQAFHWAQQRRNPRTGIPSPKVTRRGVESPAAIKLGPPENKTVEQAINDAVERESAETRTRRWWERVKRTLRRKVAHYFWRDAARQTLVRFTAEEPTAREVVCCVMGHTHVPDRYDAGVINGKQCHYVNSGTWVGSGHSMEDRQYATYLYIDAAGTVSAHDWIWDRKHADATSK